MPSSNKVIRASISLSTGLFFTVVTHLSLNAFVAHSTRHPAESGGDNLEIRMLLVDDFASQPRQGTSFWPHNRLGGDRGAIDVSNGILDWDRGAVTATITAGTKFGLYTALNHPITDHTPLNFDAIFPSQIRPYYQGRITNLQFQLLAGQGIFSAELKAQDPLSPAQEIIKWQESVTLSGGPQTLQFSLPVTLGEIQNLNWQVIGNAGDFVVIDEVGLRAELPHLDTPERAFLWSYGMLLNNWDPASGLTRDHAYYAAGGFDNISASGMQAAAAVMAWRLGFIPKAAAIEIVTGISQALLELPRCQGLWPHFVEQLQIISGTQTITVPQIISGTEWSSIDTIIALIALLEARQALDLDPTVMEEVLVDIDWPALILANGSISHGYVTDCSQRLEDQEGGIAGGWRDFGTESWLVNLGYAAATGQVADFDHTPPTYNGSGFIDELAWLIVPPPQVDRWGTEWGLYRRQAAACQLAYYQDQRVSCLFYYKHPFYSSAGLFGLSAAEVPDLSAVTNTQTYIAFGVGGEIPANDGIESLGHAVIIPHYAALIASLQPTQAITFWEWLEMKGLFTPLNNTESFMCMDEITCEQIVWNNLKGSWNLSLQTLGWGRFLAGDDNPLYQGMWANKKLREGYITICGPACWTFLPVIIQE